jgi:hypothetical protein
MFPDQDPDPDEGLLSREVLMYIKKDFAFRDDRHDKKKVCTRADIPACSKSPRRRHLRFGHGMVPPEPACQVQGCTSAVYRTRTVIHSFRTVILVKNGMESIAMID